LIWEIFFEICDIAHNCRRQAGACYAGSLIIHFKIDFYMMKYPIFRTATLDFPVAANPRLNPIPRAAERPAPFEDAAFSEVWADAQHARTEFVRAAIKSLARRIRLGLAQADVGIAGHAQRKAES
jgi:hypothetical protein